MTDQNKKELSQEEKIRQLNEKRDKVIANVEEYAQAKCKKILLIAQREDGIIMDIPLKGLPNFADERLLMTELMEANLALRVIMGMEHKIQVMINRGVAELAETMKTLIQPK